MRHFGAAAVYAVVLVAGVRPSDGTAILVEDWVGQLGCGPGAGVSDWRDPASFFEAAAGAASLTDCTAVVAALRREGLAPINTVCGNCSKASAPQTDYGCKVVKCSNRDAKFICQGGAKAMKKCCRKVRNGIGGANLWRLTAVLGYFGAAATVAARVKLSGASWLPFLFGVVAVGNFAIAIVRALGGEAVWDLILVGQS